MSPNFGEILKKKREDAGETQQELAYLLKVGIRQVQRYEKDLIPDLKKMQVLSTHYKYDFLSHVNTENNMTAASEEKKGKDIINNPTINKILDGHLKLINAAADQAAATLIREKNYANLIEENKEFARMINPTVSQPQEISLSASPTVAELLVSLAQAGCGKTWQTVEEGIAVLHSFLHETQKKKNVSKTHTHGD